MSKGYDLPLHVAKAVEREAGDDAIRGRVIGDRSREDSEPPTGEEPKHIRPILWVGQPDAARVFWTTAVIWCFGVPWMAFCLFWEAAAVHTYLTGKGGGASILLVLWGLPFLAIGAAMMAAPWLAGRGATNQAHVVTPRGIFTITASRSGTVKVDWTDASRIVATQRTERTDGFGDFKISRGRQRDSDGDLVEDSDTWIGIPDVKHVETLVRGLIASR